MMNLVIVALLCAVSYANLMRPDFGHLSDEHIDYINNIADTTWKAGRNFDKEDYEHVKRILGVPDIAKAQFLARQLPRQEFARNLKDSELPENFDPREVYPNCPSLKEVRDQGDCGSCWAVSAAETMTDRICIHSQGKVKFHFSAEDILACCHNCGFGCGGGYPVKAWDYYQQKGVVSGGPYNSSEGCLPYEIAPTGHPAGGQPKRCGVKDTPTPKCKRSCEASYKTPLSQDKHFSTNTYTISGEDNIKQELVQNGPVEATFVVHDDFMNYKSGVYQYTSGSILGSHAVKMIGYGVENGVKYWLVANSWNYGWGEKGFFKILRGRDECGIETGVVAGIPKY